jgi:small subunit ribosomal protein S7
VGGANYQVPVPVSPVRQDTLAVRWIVDIARNKSGASFDKILMDELVGAFNNESDAVKKKMDVEKMAEANKAFAHFRW